MNGSQKEMGSTIDVLEEAVEIWATGKLREKAGNDYMGTPRCTESLVGKSAQSK